MASQALLQRLLMPSTTTTTTPIASKFKRAKTLKLMLTVFNPRLALVGLIIPPAPVCVRWLFSYDHARRYNALCGGHFQLTLTAVALLLHSMENSIVLMGLRAVFSDWLHPIITTNQITVYLKHVGLF